MINKFSNFFSTLSIFSFSIFSFSQEEAMIQDINYDAAQP